MSHLVAKATALAFRSHAGQKRKFSRVDEDYVQHPVRVALRVSRLEYADDEVVAAALLHDVIEDCGITYESLRDDFGQRVADLVVDLTDRFTKADLPNENRASRKHREALRLASVPTWSKNIKLADLIDNLNSLEPDDGFASVFVSEALEIVMLFDRCADVDRQSCCPFLLAETAAAIARLRGKSHADS